MNAGSVVFSFKGDTKNLDGSINSVSKKGSVASKSMVAGLGKITKAGAIAGAALAGVVLKKGWDRMVKIDDAKAKLEALGNSAEDVQKIMNNALDSVKGTSYGMDEAATTAASAVASGIKPGQELERYLTLVADAASVAGTDMSEMGSIFNKVSANGKISAEEINQLADRGIPIWSLLAKAAGKSVAEVRKDVRDGKVDIDQFTQAMEIGMGGAAKTIGSSTISGAIKNIGASISRIGQNFLGSSDDANSFAGKVLPMLNSLQTWLGKVEEKAKVIGPVIADAFTIAINVISNVIKFIGKIWPVLFPLITLIITYVSIMKVLSVVINAVKTAQLLLNAVMLMNPVVLIIAGIVALIATVILLWNKCDWFRNFWIGLWEAIKSVFIGAWEGIKAAFEAVKGFFTETIPSIFQKVIDFFKNNWKMILLFILNPFAGVIAKLYQTSPKFRKFVDTIANFFKSLPGKIWNFIKSLPSRMLNIGKDIVKGIGNGITKGISWLKNRITEFVGNVTKFIKKLFKIGSPSKLMEKEIGQWIPKGIAVGITANTDSVKNAMSDISSSLGISPNVANTTSNNFSPNVIVNNNINMKQDNLGQLVSNIKTISGGAKNDYNYGMGV